MKKRKFEMRKDICRGIWYSVATIGTKLADNDKISSFGLMFSNLEALASAEGGYDQKIWERFYRPDGTGYNCAQPGNETCTGR